MIALPSNKEGGIQVKPGTTVAGYRNIQQFMKMQMPNTQQSDRRPRMPKLSEANGAPRHVARNGLIIPGSASTAVSPLNQTSGGDPRSIHFERIGKRLGTQVPGSINMRSPHGIHARLAMVGDSVDGGKSLASQRQRA